MTVIAIVSPKGGVGKTTVSVNLACALAERGRSVRLVDLDPQNALRLHLGADPGDANGLLHQTLQQSSWSYAEYESAYGVSFIPYGKASEIERITFEAQLVQQPDWLRDNLASLDSVPGGVTIIDTPPGPSVYVQQVLSLANLVLVVMIPDAGSYATLPSIEGLLDYYCKGRSDFYGAYYVLNQFDAEHALNRDIKNVMQASLGERLAPQVIHRDESLSEALAYQQPVRQYEPASLAVEDLRHLSVWLESRLNRMRSE
ncbi:MAG: cellulose synthase operon protein YhjQ [Gallionellaceae bacterium CG1_02_56_997]|nr:MAG: cellulose synthase operon protein YhjQ [Gallionellaceae bacterium CG1_02_56_997]PIV91961.1 MAG: cellulose synthase operon protein YhjQ [Gallionellales bacterium CG17_big_fil_post_rev_8_21_14_2_50_54_146]HCJ51626.1 cellulose synthase operon protein YhjQ [Gallionella sp.]